MYIYTITCTTSFERQFKKLPKKIQEDIYELTEQMQKNITVLNTKLLKGNWKGIQALGFHKRPAYRLLFSVEEQTVETQIKGKIILLLVATREQMNRLYKLPTKYVQQYLNSPLMF